MEEKVGKQPGRKPGRPASSDPAYKGPHWPN